MAYLFLMLHQPSQEVAAIQSWDAPALLAALAPAARLQHRPGAAAETGGAASSGWDQGSGGAASGTGDDAGGKGWDRGGDCYLQGTGTSDNIDNGSCGATEVLQLRFKMLGFSVMVHSSGAPHFGASHRQACEVLRRLITALGSAGQPVLAAGTLLDEGSPASVQAAADLLPAVVAVNCASSSGREGFLQMLTAVLRNPAVSAQQGLHLALTQLPSLLRGPLQLMARHGTGVAGLSHLLPGWLKSQSSRSLLPCAYDLLHAVIDAAERVSGLRGMVTQKRACQPADAVIEYVPCIFAACDMHATL